jgi:hypothetical protein
VGDSQPFDEAELAIVREVLEHVSPIVGGEPQVRAYYDDTERFKTAVMDVPDRPDRWATTFGTLGLCAHTIHRVSPDGRDVRVEFIGTCGTEWDKVFGPAMSSCAIQIIKNGSSCEPGTVYLNIVGQYDPGLNMKHVLFVPPFSWADIPNLDIGDWLVTWLQVVPISDAELAFRGVHGPEALEDLFEKVSIDVYDLDRPSATDRKRKRRFFR